VEGIASNQDARSTGSTEGPTPFDHEATSGWRCEFRGNATVKPISPLDGDPERVGLKKTTELCVLVYVGPNFRTKTVLISGRSGNHAHRGLDLPVCPANGVCLHPGGQTVIRIEYGHTNPQREVVWAGRGDHWVTQIIYTAKSWPVAVKVVNILDKTVWIDPWTPVARIVEFGCFSSAGRFVRPGLTRYQEWQTLVYEHTNSNQARLCQERKDQMLRDAAPPCVPQKGYPWPTK
jgi:hypothetical protein